jgi:hypothetical protein
LLESTTFDKLTAEHRDRRVGRKPVVPSNGCAVYSRSGTAISPDWGDEDLLLVADVEASSQVSGIPGQSAYDCGEPAKERLLPGPGEAERQSAGNAADLVMMIREKIPDEEQAIPDAGPPNHFHKRRDRHCGHPRDGRVKAGKIETAFSDPRCSPAAQHEFAGMPDQPAEAGYIAW